MRFRIKPYGPGDFTIPPMAIAVTSPNTNQPPRPARLQVQEDVPYGPWKDVPIVGEFASDVEPY
jgi:hypothetical protein